MCQAAQKDTATHLQLQRDAPNWPTLDALHEVLRKQRSRYKYVSMTWNVGCLEK